VLEVTVPPGVREPLHAHRYPSVLYYVSAAHMNEYSPGAPPVDRGHKGDGAVLFLPVGPPHQMENLETSKPLKAIRVELKKVADGRLPVIHACRIPVCSLKGFRDPAGRYLAIYMELVCAPFPASPSTAI